MKALFNKFTRHKQNNSTQEINANSDPNPSNLLREKLVLPPLVGHPSSICFRPLTPPSKPRWPPPQPKSDPGKALPPPIDPELSPRRASSPPASPLDTDHPTPINPTTAQDKKVAFISPSQTPNPATTPLAIADTSEPQPRSSEGTASRINLSRASGKFNQTSVNTNSYIGNTASRPFAARQLSNDVSSMRSGSPYSQSANSSRILAAPSWSAAAEEDLVCNLGPRERTRQEVLWEIVASEERYASPLYKSFDLSFVADMLPSSSR